MKFVVDQQLPPILAEWLRETGCDARHVREFGMASAPDEEIWESAKDDGFCVITKDEDFVKLWRVKRRGQSSGFEWGTAATQP